MTGTVSRALFLLICSHAIARQVSRMPWHPVPRRAFSLYLGAGALTCSRLIKLRLLISYVFIIRKRRFAVVVCIGFTNAEYHIVCVDFIVALRRTKGRGRRTLRSPPSPSSGLHLIHPGNPLRRGITAAAGWGQYWIPVSGADRSSPLRYIVWVLCVRAGAFRVSVDFVGNKSFVFHWWWDRLFVPAATLGFVMVYCWDYR